MIDPIELICARDGRSGVWELIPPWSRARQLFAAAACNSVFYLDICLNIYINIFSLYKRQFEIGQSRTSRAVFPFPRAVIVPRRLELRATQAKTGQAPHGLHPPIALRPGLSAGAGWLTWCTREVAQVIGTSTCGVGWVTCC